VYSGDYLNGKFQGKGTSFLTQEAIHGRITQDTMEISFKASELVRASGLQTIFNRVVIAMKVNMKTIAKMVTECTHGEMEPSTKASF